MAETGTLKRLGGGRWETRDGRFAIEPQSGTWVIVDNEQTDELGLPLVRGPFGSLSAARDAIEAARAEGTKPSPLAERIDDARRSAEAGPRPVNAAPEPRPTRPEPLREPRWLRDLEPAAQRRARNLIARLEKMGVEDADRIVRAEVADGQPALARLAIERALGRAAVSPGVSPAAVRAAVKVILQGADVELGVSWKLVEDEGRSIQKLEIPG
jgi:hypothetical protein